MSRRQMLARKRIGRVSLYEHHGNWWLYHRDQGKPSRRNIGSLPLAECEASLLNAQLVATEADLPLAKLVLDRFAGVLTDWRADPGTPNGGGVDTSGDTPSVPPTASVTELRSSFLEHHEHVLRSSIHTVSRYRTATLHLENFARQKGIAEALSVSPADFIAYLRSIEISPNGHANTARRKLADKGVRYIAECCRSLYHYALHQGQLPAGTINPFSRDRMVRIKIRDAKPIFVFDADQELSFFTAAEPWSFGLHFALAKTGLRPGELVRLLVEDVDLSGGWMCVRGKPELGWWTKTGTERRVPLLPEAAALLRERIAGRSSGVLFLRKELYTTGASPSATGNRNVLAALARSRIAAQRTTAGAPLRRHDEWKIYDRLWQDAGAIPIDCVRTSYITVARKAGLVGATCPKSWRHTFATLLQQANVDLLVRQETMGHKPAAADRSALGMTGTYTHTTPDFQKREIERALRLRPGPLQLARNLLELQDKHPS